MYNSIEKYDSTGHLDVVWNTILQGAAEHVDKDMEKHHYALVSQKGKKNSWYAMTASAEAPRTNEHRSSPVSRANRLQSIASSEAIGKYVNS